jgi:hypothetical protein
LRCRFSHEDTKRAKASSFFILNRLSVAEQLFHVKGEQDSALSANHKLAAISQLPELSPQRR